jgi:DNA-binding winged helix-turn-helix (wHTH) protein/Tol biopolymer transport system component
MSGHVYQFGDFELDCGRFELSRNSHRLRVERKPMELLILLVSRQGQLVTRAEIAERLWSSEVFVDTEHGINTAIRKLRHLLRDDSDDPRFIQTVTGMGYRFVAQVSTIVRDQPAPSPEGVPISVPTVALKPSRKPSVWYVGAGTFVVLALLGASLYRFRHRPPEVSFTQLTDFTDSAVQPAISPDGRMVAFIRGANTFITPDQIYVQMLPSGEARRVTDDDRPKYGLAFSPDGSEIAYTVLEGPVFSTYRVSILGGEPRLLQKNAAGLVWLDPQKLLFSEAPSGIHLSVVITSLTHTDIKEVYSPAHERGMAHYSFPSPDRRWALIAEMNGNGEWAPCRLVALEGQSSSRTVGPAGACTSAGWSSDGRWMYFTAYEQGRSHVWRQRYPDGGPEQITFGPTEENGIAVDPNGGSLITSSGIHESAIWIHDPKGERSLSSEGEVLSWPFPVFSPDGDVIYYLLRRWNSSGAELWQTDVGSGKSEPVFPGIAMGSFDISPDGKQVLYATSAANGESELWIAPLDRDSPAMKIAIPGAQSPRFGTHGTILFQRTEGAANYLEKANGDGTHISKVIPYPITDFQGVSPGRRWATVGVTKTAEGNSAAVLIVPIDGGAALHPCVSYCTPKWSTDGDFLFIPVEDPSRTSPGRSVAIPAGSGESLPNLPAQGIATGTELGTIKGVRSVDRAGIVPGKDPEHYVWVNTTVHRNLYRVSLP